MTIRALTWHETGDGMAVLVGAAIGGNRLAVESLLAVVRPLVTRYCRAMVGSQERSYAAADDVARQVCLAVLAALPSYQDPARPLLALVYGIAAHHVADVHRSAARTNGRPVPELRDSPEPGDGPQRRAGDQELSGRMARLMGTLPPRQREILTLRVMVGLSVEETAAAVGSTPGAVRVEQHRALKRLRKSLAAEEVDNAPPAGPVRAGPGQVIRRLAHYSTGRPEHVP